MRETGIREETPKKGERRKGLEDCSSGRVEEGKDVSSAQGENKLRIVENCWIQIGRLRRRQH